MQNTNNYDIKPGDMYKHFKGGIYKIIGVAHHSETLEELVVYQAQYDSPEWGKKPIWVRPIDDFTGYKEIDGKKIPRFEKIKKADR